MNRTIGYQSNNLKYKGLNFTKLPNVSDRSLLAATPEPHTHYFTNTYSMATTTYKRKEEITLNSKLDIKKNIKKLRKDTVNVPKLDIKVLESWINTVLKGVETSAIPKQLLTKETSIPLSRFGIDRKQLTVT